LEGLAGAVTKLSRTQFKANALAEAQEQRTAAALSMLQEIVARREEAGDERERDRIERVSDVRADARAELAVELLPALDGLEAALESGRSLLGRRRRGTALATSVAEHGFLWRLTRPAGEAQGGSDDEDHGLAAWLQGP